MDELGERISFSAVLGISYKDYYLPEETEATNELIDDGLIVQPLSTAEIEALKSSGAPASV